MTLLWLLMIVIFLAYSNGANDNFKGVATLFGSRTTTYRKALWWATGTTFAGSVAAVALSGRLMKVFSGKGLVPDVLVGEPTFLMAVACGAALTVMVATVTGLPISTTHALTGALVGTGLVAAGSVNVVRLSSSFFLPLAVSPLLSFTITGILYPALRLVRTRLGIERQMCLCVDGSVPQPVQVRPNGTAILQASGVMLTAGQLSACSERYHGRVFGIDSQWVLDRFHFMSAGAVSFARGLNDTPKIVALLMAAKGLGMSLSVALLTVGAAMAIGGLLNARKVAVTMSQYITPMNHGQGFTANVVTALLVMLASPAGIPVSTTHVSCGSLFGLGAVSGTARWSVIRTIVFAWVVTLPLAAFLAAGSYWLIR